MCLHYYRKPESESGFAAAGECLLHPYIYSTQQVSQNITASVREIALEYIECREGKYIPKVSQDRFQLRN